VAVRGRKTGQWRGTTVNVLAYAGERYLVVPRGQTQWVRNLRAAGKGELRLGRRTERFKPTELADADKPAVLRAYLERWKFELGNLFGGAGPEATDEQLLRIAPGCPIFHLASAPRE
jgi:deazaflavin-dependent oxidoreductase (nitroreductase family)